MTGEDLILAILTSSAVSAVVTGLFQWSVQARFQKEVDRHKHDLEKLMLTTKLKADKQFTIYPEVDVKLHAGLGHARKLNLQPDDLSGLSDQSLHDELSAWDPPLAKQTVEETVAHAKTLRGAARSAYLKTVVRKYDAMNAGKCLVDGNNYIISAGVFLDPEIYSAAITAIAGTRAAIIAGRDQSGTPTAMAALESATAQVRFVRELLRQSLEGNNGSRPRVEHARP